MRSEVASRNQLKSICSAWTHEHGITGDGYKAASMYTLCGLTRLAFISDSKEDERLLI